MPKATIIGNTTWGNTLGALLSKKGITVKLWARSEAEAQGVNRKAHNYHSTSDIAEAVDGANLVIWATPSQSLRRNVNQLKEHLSDSMLLLSAAKGLEVDSCKTMSQVMEEELAPALRRQICVLSGPNLAREIAQGLPAASVVAAREVAIAETARDLMNCPDFFVLASDDIIGVELGGALKNIIALGAGMVDGLGLGDNAKAAFISWTWSEAASLGITLGARADTFYGLAGLGDLMATCASNLSRNHYVGYELAQGRSLAEISASMTQVAEGITTTLATHQLAEKLGLKLPFTRLIYQVLFENLPPKEAHFNFNKLVGIHGQALLEIPR